MDILYMPKKWGNYVTYRDLAHKFLLPAITSEGDSYRKHNPRFGDEVADMIVSWGVAANREIMTLTHRNLVIEAGHLGDRLENLSLSWNGLASQGKPALPAWMEEGRGEPFYDMIRPPKSKAAPKRMLIIAQCPADHSMSFMGYGGTGDKHVDLVGRDDTHRAWIRRTALYWRRKGMEVRVKVHPMHAARGDLREWCEIHDLKHAPASMEESIQWADAATALCSTALVECALSGLYVIPCHSMAMTWPIRSSFGNWRRPLARELRAWLDWVCLHQMNRKEFAEFWPHIRATI